MIETLSIYKGDEFHITVGERTCPIAETSIARA
jgi:hypothetical protein